MQDNLPTNQRKKILYIIALSILIVAVIASATAYVLSRISEPASNQESSVSLAQQLAELYRDSGDVNQDVTLDTPTVQDSSTEGYKNAHALILETDSDESTFAHFYQTPDETWHFFIVASDQDQVGCSNYNTKDLVNAFVGFTCQSAEGSSYVQAEQPKFEILPDSIGE